MFKNKIYEKGCNCLVFLNFFFNLLKFNPRIHSLTPMLTSQPKKCQCNIKYFAQYLVADYLSEITMSLLVMAR
jgi:hypothetical protein